MVKRTSVRGGIHRFVHIKSMGVFYYIENPNWISLL